MPKRSYRPRVCLRCACEFMAPLSNIKQGYGFYCSKSCARRSALDPVDRFWSHVDKSDKCWLWLLSTTGSKGYGEVKVEDGRRLKPSQFAWDLAGGPTRGNLFVCHTCDIPRCCRNDDWGTYAVDGVAYPRIGHLFLAPARVNARDAVAKGRLLTGDRNPSRIHPERLARGERSGARLHPEGHQGERNGRAKRTAAWAAEVRRRYAAGETQVALAAEHGVHQAYISQIVLRKIWRDT